MAMSAARRRTITIYETLDSYNFYFPHVAASASATVVAVQPVLFPCSPQKANDDLQHPHPHALKRDVKVFNLCSQWKAGAHRPDQRLYLTLGLCLCLCLGLCVCGLRMVWKHIWSYYAFYCHWKICVARKDLDIVWPMLLLLLLFRFRC